jgi:hypothetical protein
LRWRDVSTPLSFNDWLEQATSQSLFRSGAAESAEALEDLDSFLIATIVELHDLLGIELSATELEERLKLLWQRTYLYALNRNEAAFTALVARSRSVLAAEQQTDLRAIYRTSMRPRSARRLLSMAESLRELFRRAADYSHWTSEERLKFIVEIINALIAVPQFDFKDEFKPRDPSIRDLLSWWVGEYDGVVPPKEISRWYALSSNIFSYRLTWALSSALLSLISDDPLDGSHLENRLQGASLPRVLQWFRDMMLVGVLDPVAAILLQRGAAITRFEARAIALTYYETFGVQSDECYSYESINRWISANFPAPRGHAESPHVINVEVTTTDLIQDRYRVRPYSAPGRTIWRDVSGYPIATSTDALPPIEPWTDYILSVSESLVRSSPYLRPGYGEL